MAEQFYTILTSIGKAKIANASVLGTKINLATLAVGDGGGKYYNPTENQETLVNEVWRGNVGAVATDSENSNWIVIETMIAGNVGGFFIREVGVFDDEGNLIAIGKYPETYKPIVSDGATKDLTIRIILEVSNASNVTLKIDPTIILATKKDIETLDNKIKNIKIPVTKVNNKLGDVTLKAEDIKANNDKTIEENLQEVTSQMADFTDRFGKQSKDISGQDLNNIKDTGFYRGANIINAPNTGTYYVEVKRYSSTSNNVHQKATFFNGTEYYERFLVNSEWREWKRCDVGDLSTLKTTNKTSLVSSINELFQFADNGKKNIASVIGSPLSNTDSFDSMKSKIQILKNTFASNLSGKGQSSSGSDTLNNLINKVVNINTGKKIASGKLNPPDSKGIVVSGLSFKPSYIIIYKVEYEDNGYYRVDIGTYGLDNDMNGRFVYSTVSSTGSRGGGGSFFPITPTQDGFVIDRIYYSGYYYLAIE